MFQKVLVSFISGVTLQYPQQMLCSRTSIFTIWNCFSTILSIGLPGVSNLPTQFFPVRVREWKQFLTTVSTDVESVQFHVRLVENILEGARLPFESLRSLRVTDLITSEKTRKSSKHSLLKMTNLWHCCPYRKEESRGYIRYPERGSPWVTRIFLSLTNCWISPFDRFDANMSRCPICLGVSVKKRLSQRLPEKTTRNRLRIRIWRIKNDNDQRNNAR